MRIIKITKKYGEVKNLGNFESVRIETELEAEVSLPNDPGHDEALRAESDELLKQAQRLTHRDLNRIIVPTKDEENG